MVREGQFRVMTMGNVKSFNVMYVLRTYIVIHICFGLNSVLSVGFVTLHLCSQFDQFFLPS